MHTLASKDIPFCYIILLLAILECLGDLRETRAIFDALTFHGLHNTLGVFNLLLIFLQLQISELTNGVINTAFLMLYKVC